MLGKYRWMRKSIIHTLHEFLLQLRKSMIQGESGDITAQVKKFYGKKVNRIRIQTQTYYYAPIPNTPYRYFY